MSDSFKILGQAVLGTGSWSTTIYTVPDTPSADLAPRQIMQAIVSTIVVCNRDADLQKYSIRFVPKGETPGDKHTVISTKSLLPYATDVLSLGVGLSTGDIMYGYGSAANFSISVFGIEML